MNIIKMAIMVYLLLMVVLTGCSLVQQDRIKNFIPGVYVRYYADEYTESYDTIRITRSSGPGKENYSVIKRRRTAKVDNNGKIVPGYELKKWTATFDAKSQSLWITNAGKAIYFYPARRELRIGTEPYKKL